MQRSFGFRAAVASAWALAGCNDAILVEVTADRPIDSFCIGVADTEHDSYWGQYYKLGEMITLPGSLRLEAGSANSATVWVRGDRGGVPVSRALAATEFGDDLRLDLAKCPRGSAASPHVVGDAVGPSAARLVASQGAGGTVVIAIGAGGSAIIDANGSLVSTAGPMPPANVSSAVAADVDADCDDDIVIAAPGGPPIIWRRDGRTFTPTPGLTGAPPARVLAAADVNGDGLADIFTGSPNALAVWKNNGGGRFSSEPADLSALNLVPTLSALAAGDIDGDGSPDLVAGQTAGPLQAWTGSSVGSYVAASVLPSITLAVRELYLADADADSDFAPDLAIAIAGGPMKLFIARGSVLEDQSALRLPNAPQANAVALGNWDSGCAPDAVVANDAMTFALNGALDGVLALDTQAMAPAATDVVMADLDDDGDLDAVIATATGVRWLVR